MEINNRSCDSKKTFSCKACLLPSTWQIKERWVWQAQLTDRLTDRLPTPRSFTPENPIFYAPLLPTGWNPPFFLSFPTLSKGQRTGFRGVRRRASPTASKSHRCRCGEDWQTHAWIQGDRHAWTRWDRRSGGQEWKLDRAWSVERGAWIHFSYPSMTNAGEEMREIKWCSGGVDGPWGNNKLLRCDYATELNIHNQWDSECLTNELFPGSWGHFYMQWLVKRKKGTLHNNIAEMSWSIHQVSSNIRTKLKDLKGLDYLSV